MVRLIYPEVLAIYVSLILRHFEETEVPLVPKRREMPTYNNKEVKEHVK